ncbi:MAG: RNA methyltransferase, partial [Pseudomonadota bacterium]
IVEPQSTIEATLASFDKPPLVIATSAQERKTIPMVGFEETREHIFAPEDDQEVLILFGTGFGLADEAYVHCDQLLAPVKGHSADDYRHLSVRSAVSIILDRLLGA